MSRLLVMAKRFLARMTDQQTGPVVKGRPHRIERSRAITIHLGRWDVRFDIETESGTQSFIASADAGYTEHNTIWFGTPDEYEEARVRARRTRDDDWGENPGKPSITGA